MSFELIQIESDFVDPDVVEEQFGDQVALGSEIGLQLPLVVFLDWQFSRRCLCEGLFDFPSSFEHGWGGRETPGVVVVFKDAKVFIDAQLHISCLSAISSGHFSC